MSETITSPQGENALSDRDGTSALAALRQKQPQEVEESETEEPEAESEVEEEGQDETPEAEGESEAEGEEESEESTDSEEDQSEDEPVSLELPNGEKITADEAVKGYLRHSDYTRKTQGLSQEKAKLDAEHAERLKAIEALYSDLTTFQPREPDWDKFAEQHGEEETLKAQRQWSKREKALNDARKQLTENQKRQQEQAQVKARETLQSGMLIPEWANSDKLDEGLTNVANYLVEQGYPEEALASLADPLAISIAEKARRYDALQKVKPEAKKAVRKKPKPLKAGSKTQVSTGQDRDKQKAINRFRQTKTLEDGKTALQKLRLAAEG